MLGLGNKLQKTGLKKIYPGVATGGLVLKSDFGNREVVPISDGSSVLDGSTDHIATGLQPDFIHTNATFSYWVKLADFTDMQTSGCHNTKRFYLGFNTTSAMFGVGGTAKTSTDVSSYISTNTWIHLCLVAEDGVSKYYIDGVQRDSSTYTQSSGTNPNTNLLIGATSHTSTIYHAEGNICNVGLWSAALTEAQIKSIMYKKYGGLNTSEKANLVSWWNLSANAKDLHGGNHGTLS